LKKTLKEVTIDSEAKLKKIESLVGQIKILSTNDDDNEG